MTDVYKCYSYKYKWWFYECIVKLTDTTCLKILNHTTGGFKHKTKYSSLFIKMNGKWQSNFTMARQPMFDKTTKPCLSLCAHWKYKNRSWYLLSSHSSSDLLHFRFTINFLTGWLGPGGCSREAYICKYNVSIKQLADRPINHLKSHTALEV